MSSQPNSAARQFAAVPGTVRAARRFVEETLASASVHSADAVLFTSELVSNAVHYAETEIEVVVKFDLPIVRIEVHDGFSMTEAFRVLVETERDISDVDPNAPNGRGLLIIRGKAVGFGVIDKGERGKAVWFELAADSPSRSTTAGPTGATPA